MRSVGSVLAFVSVLAFLPHAAAQTIRRVSVANDGSQVASGGSFGDVSDDGLRVVFTSSGKITAQDTNTFIDVYLRDLAAGTTTLVSVNPSGKAGDKASHSPRISADGTHVAFLSLATSLVSGDHNGKVDVFVRDLAAGVTTRVSVASDGSESNADSLTPVLSGDGALVAFSSSATNLVANDANGVDDVFVHDRASRVTTRASFAFDGSEANAVSFEPDLSRDGRVVAFTSWASNLVPADTNTFLDVFVRDLAAGTIVRANVASDGSEIIDGYTPMLSGDGNVVAFATDATDLVPDDSNNTMDVFVRDLSAGTTTIVSADSEGQVRPVPDLGGSQPTAVSGDGRYVVFFSSAIGLAEGESHSDYFDWDVYVRDLELGMTTRQSNAPSGLAGDSYSLYGRISADGRFVTFESWASDLVPGDTNNTGDIFLVERPLRAPTAAEYGTGWAGRHGVPALTCGAAPRLNQPITLSIDNSLGAWTVALLYLGTQSTQIPTSAGGDLLVLPDATLLIALSPGGLDLSEKVPPDERLAAISIFLQVLELDPYATDGISFTNGLELDIGF